MEDSEKRGLSMTLGSTYQIDITVIYWRLRHNIHSLEFYLAISNSFRTLQGPDVVLRLLNPVRKIL